jgi:hypothetical protein
VHWHNKDKPRVALGVFYELAMFKSNTVNKFMTRLSRIFNPLFFALILLVPSFVIAQQKPKLVVGLVVDQMRWDYLYRYADRYGNGGFKRLLKEGFSCENAIVNYVPTFTACGHASIYTGTVPAINGITGNEWIDAKTGAKQYCTADDNEKTVGGKSQAGNMSPKKLLTTTIGDELKLATNFRSKVIGIALKDRGGILPAGHTADAAYWLEEATGNWITSSYYKKELPTWVINFNAQKRTEKLLDKGWHTLYPLQTYIQSSADNSKFEGLYKNETQPVFPHHFKIDGIVQLNLIKSTPFGNQLTLEFAEQAIANEGLGKDEVTDLLAISLSGTDYVGHQFGPNAVEIEDTYLRLDAELAKFFNYLDQNIGAGNYTFFLTADHGAAHNPGYSAAQKIPSGYWDAHTMETELNEYLATKYLVSGLIKPFLNYQLQFDAKIIEAQKIDMDALKKDCIQFINRKNGLAYAIDLEKANESTLPQSLQEKIVNGYYRNRSGAIQIVLEPGWFQQSTDLTGTIHGSWNPYDSHIPLIFMGSGVKKGILHRSVSICDIAPTISALLHIQEPSGNIGKVILEALK